MHMLSGPCARFNETILRYRFWRKVTMICHEGNHEELPSVNKGIFWTAARDIRLMQAPAIKGMR